jgi:GTP-binding protein
VRILDVEFAGAIGQVGQAIPEAARGIPHVAFSGRSNVGKSSLINRLLGRTRTAIARVSQQPGKTQEVNFYRVRSDRGVFFVVDLPGYGYARVPQALRERWEPLIRGHLSASTDLAGVVQLVDARQGPTPDDLRAVDFLAELGVPTLFVMTKIDKLNRTKQAEAVRDGVATLGIDADQVIPFSALNGEGREELLETLGELLFPNSADPLDAPPAD